MVDVRHAGALGHFLDAVARLLLGAHEEHRAAAPRQVVGELLRLLEQLLSLEQVDDVDAVALTEDEAPHLRVPAPRLVAEVHAGLQQLADAHLSGHGVLSVVWRYGPSGATRTRRLVAGQDPRALRAGSGTVGACQSTRRAAASAGRPGLRRRR